MARRYCGRRSLGGLIGMDALAGAVWTVVGTVPGAVTDPSGLDAAGGARVQAQAPGTVAGALRAAHGVDVALAADIDGQDWWWRTTADASGPHLLIAEGLATIADVWVGGAHVLRSETMFRQSVVALPDLAGPTEIVLRFAAPMAVLARRPRPRWKSTLVPEQRWRFVRTTLLGRVPTWAGTVAPAGPWRPIRLESLDGPVIASRRVAARLDGRDGVVDAELDVRGPVESAMLHIGETHAVLHRGSDGRLRCSLRVRDVDLWWPHTHGGQARYAVTISWDGRDPVPLTDVAFRTVSADRSDGGFALCVNGVRVFVRGACWSPLDAVSLQADDGALREAVTRARDAGHNLIRVPATSVYESDAFYAACDDAGLLVWQDCMLATLDPPDTDEFAAELTAEITELADRLAGRACIAIVCGGAETEQQPAMLGLAHQSLPVLTDTIPAVLRDRLPDVPYVTSTPSGGAMPMHASTGIAQYFGVGAYLRPLLDVRAAEVRFAAEALAFSIPPENDALLRAFGSARVAGHDPRWKATVPRDVTAGWDFEDVRDHYVRELFAVDPMQVRYGDPERYLDLGRAAVCLAMTEVMTWWRRPRSRCGGAIVLSARDHLFGGGWGLLDAHGRPKAPWFALRPVLAPLALLVSDDGADGMTLTAVNDGPGPISGRLEVSIWNESGGIVDDDGVQVDLAPHSALDIGLDAVLGRFTDAGAYYRFGPRQRDVLNVRLRGADGALRASRTVQLGHHLRPDISGGLEASVRATGTCWVLDLAAQRPVHWLAIDSHTHEPADSWFHLAPGERRTVCLAPLDPGGTDEPRLTVRALNLAEFAAPITRGAVPGAAIPHLCGTIEAWT